MRPPAPPLAALATSLVALLAVPVAHAQSTGELSDERDRDRSRFTAELGFYTHTQTASVGPFSASVTRTLFIPSLAAYVDVLELSREVSLGADFAFRSIGTIFPSGSGSGDRADFRAGNAYLGARVAVVPTRGLRLRGGAGLAAPIVNAYDDGDIGAVSLFYSMLPNGGWDAWLAARGYLPIVLRLDGEYRQEWLFFGAETALGLGVPVLDGYEGLGIAAQLGIFGGVRPIPGLAAGLRFQTVMYDPGRSSGTDPYAVGFATFCLFARGELNAAFAELRFFFSVAENEPYRNALLLGEQAWGLYLLLGTNFDVR